MGMDEKLSIKWKGVIIGDDYRADIPKLQSRMIMRSQLHDGNWVSAMWWTSTAPVPNWWWRIWYWVLLGWKWERIEDDK